MTGINRSKFESKYHQLPLFFAVLFPLGIWSMGAGRTNGIFSAYSTGIKDFSALGTRTPSSSWLFSKIAQITRVAAHIVAFNMCTYLTFRKIFIFANMIYFWFFCTSLNMSVCEPSFISHKMREYLCSNSECLVRYEGIYKNLSINNLAVHLFCLAIAYFKTSGLVIEAVWTRNELTECLRAWKPRFQVKLLCSGVVQSKNLR